MNARYAVYFAPARSSPWHDFGGHWLGRNEFDNQPMPQPALEEIDAKQFEALTQVPRRYGFHATLKAPFHLCAGVELPQLISRLSSLATTLEPLPLGALKTATPGNFVALIPSAPVSGLHELAATCVTSLDDLRAPLHAGDLARRQADQLDARAMELLTRFGYPHVLERFRLHFTLTGPVTEEEAALVTRAAAAPVLHLNALEPLVLDRLCLFMEPSANSPFLRIADFKLGMSPETS
jgi:putative phosphonate metabolism protein